MRKIAPLSPTTKPILRDKKYISFNAFLEMTCGEKLNPPSVVFQSLPSRSKINPSFAPKNLILTGVISFVLNFLSSISDLPTSYLRVFVSAVRMKKVFSLATPKSVTVIFLRL